MFRNSVATALRNVDGLAVIGRTRHDLMGIRYDEGEGGNGGQGGDGAGEGAEDNPKPGTPQSEGFNFPADTSTADMTPDQRAEYWRHKAQKHEKIANSRRDYDSLKADSAELAQLKTANATEQEKAIEAARRDGENIGAQRYLKEAVKGRFQGLTGKASNEVDRIFAHVDALTFTDDKGDIDVTALTEYAATFGTNGGSGNNGDPVAEALKRQRQAGGGSSSSISDRRKETRESMTRKTA